MKRIISAVTSHMAMVVIAAMLAIAALPGCGLKLRPIVDALIPAPKPAPVEPAQTPVPEPPPVVEPPPTPEPPPIVEPAPLPPFENLFIHVRGGGQPLTTGYCTVEGERRNVENGDGVIHFPIRGSVVAVCSAGGFLVKQFQFPAGHQNADLEPIAAPPLAPKPAPPTSEPTDPCPDDDGLTCVRVVAKWYPKLLTTNTYESCLEFTQRVLAALGPDWGHVGKTRGESQSVPRGFQPISVNGWFVTGVSHDAIKHRITGQVVDLITNAAARSDPRKEIHGDAGVQWELVSPEHWRENNPFVPAVPVR